MKKSLNITVGLVGILIMITICANQVSAQIAQQGKEAGKPIPSEVLKITQKSCATCHSDNGNFMAMSHLNFAKWNNYSPEKQAAKAKAMCNEVSKGKMPLKKFREKHPEAIPTPDDLKTICDWAQSIQVTKK